MSEHTKLTLILSVLWVNFYVNVRVLGTSSMCSVWWKWGSITGISFDIVNKILVSYGERERERECIII